MAEGLLQEFTSALYDSCAFLADRRSLEVSQPHLLPGFGDCLDGQDAPGRFFHCPERVVTYPEGSTDLRACHFCLYILYIHVCTHVIFLKVSMRFVINSANQNFLRAQPALADPQSLISALVHVKTVKTTNSAYTATLRPFPLRMQMQNNVQRVSPFCFRL